MTLPLDHPFFSAAAAILGAVVGSFLNVCIYRMPRNLKVNEPVRSFCPSCKKTIPWYRNIPLLSWLLLRGKCADCGTPIAFRYFLIEALTAGVFLALWQTFHLPLAPVYWIFLSLLIVATFIDLEHLIIPDEITLGGIGIGLILSALAPSLHQEAIWWRGLLDGLAAAAFGYFLVWGIVEAGKLAFGKKRLKLDPAEAFVLKVEEDNAWLQLGEDSLPWEDIFSRPSDELILECTDLRLGGETFPQGTVRIRYDRFQIEGRDFTPIEEAGGLAGTATSVTIPREAMGFGDVKFMGAIGAFIGWKGVLFTLFASSVVGSLVGVAVLLASRGRESARIPYGPFLALGAAIWLFGGQLLTDWYFNRVWGG